MSLSSMFEIKDTFDLLKGLINILTEYEQIKDDPIDKPKMVLNPLAGWTFSPLTPNPLSGYSGLNSTRSKDWGNTRCPIQTRLKLPI